MAKERQQILICDKKESFEINSFPTLYFYHRIFNYTFELIKENLFLEKNNKYIINKLNSCGDIIS